jgi:Lrp/AsnC family transcriptional regulator
MDLKILSCLQEDSNAPLTSLAAKVGLSPSPCSRRIERLEEDKVILRRVALLDPEKLGVRLTVFVTVRTGQHSLEWMQGFCEMIMNIPEIIEFYRMSGTVDYLLRVVVPDIAAYDRIYKKITAVPGLTDVTSSFAMERIKGTTSLPLSYALTTKSN